MYYIRFTEDIYEDLERGHSFYFRDKSPLDGLCAWSVNDMELSPYASDEEIIKSARKTAEMIARNTYGGYSSNTTYAVLRGTYAGSGNDGVLIKDAELISIETL